MACYVPKIVSYQFDELLVALLEKEHSFSFDRMDQFGFDTDHLKVLMTTNLIIEKIVSYFIKYIFIKDTSFWCLFYWKRIKRCSSETFKINYVYKHGFIKTYQIHQIIKIANWDCNSL